MAKAAQANAYIRTPRGFLRTPRWWAIPGAGTVAFLIIGVTGSVKAQAASSHSMGRDGGGTAIAFYALLIVSFLTLCGTWSAAAFPSRSRIRPDRVPMAVFVFLFLTLVFLSGAISVMHSLDLVVSSGK